LGYEGAEGTPHLQEKECEVMMLDRGIQVKGVGWGHEVLAMGGYVVQI